jgi:hypothetical protein
MHRGEPRLIVVVVPRNDHGRWVSSLERRPDGRGPFSNCRRARLRFLGLIRQEAMHAWLLMASWIIVCG